MRIIKEGSVTFEGGKIVTIEGFRVTDGGLDCLQKYVEDNYKCSSPPTIEWKEPEGTFIGTVSTPISIHTHPREDP